MKKENNKNLIAEKVISKIKKGELKMKPKAYFIAKSILVIGLLILTILLILYFTSLVIFVLKVNDILLFHGMGFQATRSILLSFPWYLVLLIFVLLILIEIISKRFQFVYRRPLLLSLFVILSLIAISSLLIERSSLHYSFFRLAEREDLPFIGKMYRDLGNLDMDDAYFGIILQKENDFWIMELDSGETVNLKVTEKTKGRHIFLEIEEGNEVIVIGEMRDGLIDVISFKKIERRFRHRNQKINER